MPVGHVHAETGVPEHQLDLFPQFYQVILRLVEHVLDLLLDLIVLDLQVMFLGHHECLFEGLLLLLHLVLDEIEQALPILDKPLILRLLLGGEVPLGRYDHAFQLGQGEPVEELLWLCHELVQPGVVVVLALVNVEGLHKFVNGLLSALLNPQERTQDLLVLMELLFLLDVLVVVHLSCL